jgi:NDP-sugar pyrophosphorylase family protein
MHEAVILAAGLGKRLRPYTLKTPKPLLPVQGKPILQWIMHALPRQITRVYVVVHYLAEQIVDWLTKQTNPVQWHVVRQEQPRGSGDAVLACRECIQGDRFLLLNGDDLYAADDLARLVEHRFGLLAYRVPEPRLFGIVRVSPQGTLAELIEKPNISGPALANAGAYMLPRDIFQVTPQLSPRREYELTQMISELAKQIPCQVLEASFWFPIGTVEAWQAAQSLELSQWIPNG